MTTETTNTPPAQAPASSSAGTALTTLGVIAFGAAMLVPIIFVAWRVIGKESPPFSGGGAAAFVSALLGLGLVLTQPSLIMDDAPAAGGEPSTMRILCLAIIFAFVAMALRTAWNTGSIPSLENQGNWVWLVTAALGGKAVQKFAEIKDAKAQGAAAGKS